MPADPSLEELIRNKEIEFCSYGRKLDTDLKRFGKSNKNLVEHLVYKSGNKMRIQGSGLQHYLTTERNLYLLAVFLAQLRERGVEKYSDMAFHVNADIEKLNRHYPTPAEIKIYNLGGEVVCDAASWVPEMPYFEKLWNFAIDYAVSADCHGHPGDEGSFRYIVSEFAENFLIGTPQQIPRYKRYALDVLPAVTKIADDLKNNPQGIFVDYTLLHSLETVAHHARLIAANVAHFSVE